MISLVELASITKIITCADNGNTRPPQILSPSSLPRPTPTIKNNKLHKRQGSTSTTRLVTNSIPLTGTATTTQKKNEKITTTNHPNTRTEDQIPTIKLEFSSSSSSSSSSPPQMIFYPQTLQTYSELLDSLYFLLHHPNNKYNTTFQVVTGGSTEEDVVAVPSSSSSSAFRSLLSIIPSQDFLNKVEQLTEIGIKVKLLDLSGEGIEILEEDWDQDQDEGDFDAADVPVVVVEEKGNERDSYIAKEEEEEEQGENGVKVVKQKKEEEEDMVTKNKTKTSSLLLVPSEEDKFYYREFI